MRPPPYRQRVFAFVARRRRLDRVFKGAIAASTLVLVIALLSAIPAGRNLAGWAAARSHWFVSRCLGVDPDRATIDADWQRQREYGITTSRASFANGFVQFNATQRRLLRFAGMDPDHVLLRWGNFDQTVILPSTVFEADDSGRSYRLRPNVRSIWIRGFPGLGVTKSCFQIPDTPEGPSLVLGTGAEIVPGSEQSTNSWGLRGPEPDLSAPFRGIVLGDSFMQGLFVGPSETPVECLKRDLTIRLHAPTEILNTGVLGYSPEQSYFTLLEFEKRFHPQFVVVSLFANDFASDFDEVLQGKAGDWEEGKYWLSRIRLFCGARRLTCLYVPVPWIGQIQGTHLAGNYPGPLSNLLQVNGYEYLDPINAFANVYLENSIEELRRGSTLPSNPFFNGRIGDAHFSARGCEVWADAVGKRLALLIEQTRAKQAHRELPF